MSTTVSMWLGVAFLFLAIAAVLLQAWLWGFPMGGEHGTPSYRSTAPRIWTRVHRACGYLYGIIYVVMMWEMLPRLWEYQVELPARTVIHLVCGILIGFLLISKIFILRFFRWFEEGAMPTLGMGILGCTIVLATLSLPFSFQAHAFGKHVLEPGNMERVQRILADLPELGAKPEELVQQAALSHGREVLVQQCVTCHDLRTILAQPRTGKRWLDTVIRMTEKPAVTTTIAWEDVPFVTAYLIAITPDIQRSSMRKHEEEEALEEAAARIEEIEVEEIEVEEIEELGDGTKAKPATAPAAKADVQPLFVKRCTECHELDVIEEKRGTDKAGWTKLVRRMVEDEGAEVSPKEARQIIGYLVEKYGP